MICKFCKRDLEENRKLKNFCNHSCKTKFQFLNPWQHEIRRIKIKEQIKKEDRKNKWNKEKLLNLTKNAREKGNKKLRELYKENKGPFNLFRWNELDNDNNIKINIINKLKKRKGTNNPNSNNKKTEYRIEEIKQYWKNYYKEHPEKHPNKIMVEKGFVSKPQMELYLLIKEKYLDAELEYPIQTNYSIRFADIGIPSLKLDIEYDGEYWHNKWFDDLRDIQLAEIGWKTIRITKDNFILCLNKIEEINV